MYTKILRPFQLVFYLAYLQLVHARVLDVSSDRRDVTSTSKAGLAWPNGRADDISQYTKTGKVSWCVPYQYDPDQLVSEFIVKGFTPGHLKEIVETLT